MSNKEKKKKDKGENKDVIVVLFVFAILILIAFSVTLCGQDDIDMNMEKQGSNYENNSDDSGKEVAVITAVGVSACIVVCFIVKKTREAKRRQEMLREYHKKQEEQKRIEEARERVKQARRQEMIEAGIRQLTERNGRGRHYVKNSLVGQRTKEDFDTYDLDDSRLEKYYRNKENDLYDDLSDDDFLDYNEQDMPETIGEKIKDWFTNYWWIVAGIVCATAVGGIVIAYFVL